jgi:hypothetical protein
MTSQKARNYSLFMLSKFVKESYSGRKVADHTWVCTSTNVLVFLQQFTFAGVLGAIYSHLRCSRILHYRITAKSL